MKKLGFLSALCLAWQGLAADDRIALIVNNKAIGAQTLQAEWQQQRPYLPKGIDEALLWQQFLEAKIQQEILHDIAQKAEISASEDEVQHALQAVAAQNQLNNPEALFQKVKQETGMSREAFLKRLAFDVVAEKIKLGMLGEQIHISAEQVDDYIAQLAFEQGTRLHVEDLLLPLPQGDAASRAPLIQERLQQVSSALTRYQGDLRQVAAALPQAQFNDLGLINIQQAPPRFARFLANLPVGEISPHPMIDADGMHFLRVRSRDSHDQKLHTTAFRVQHILIRGKDDNAKRRIQEVQSALQGGASFSALAQRFSDDAESAVSGGHLGWVQAEQLPPALGRALEALPVAQISPLIESDYGWHIAFVHEKRKVNRNEALLRQHVESMLFAQALEALWQEQLAVLRQRAYVKINP